jgi:hypothetical protein
LKIEASRHALCQDSRGGIAVRSDIDSSNHDGFTFADLRRDRPGDPDQFGTPHLLRNCCLGDTCSLAHSRTRAAIERVCRSLGLGAQDHFPTEIVAAKIAHFANADVHDADELSRAVLKDFKLLE